MIILRIITYIVALIMSIPVIITGMLAFTAAQNLSFPPESYSIRWIVRIFTDAYLIDSITRSITLAVTSSLLVTAICIPCCLIVERVLSKGREGIEAVATLPRMFPEMVLAIALLIFYERIYIAETMAGLIISHLIVCLPFAYRTLSIGVGSLDKRLEWSSDVLGASAIRGFFKVVMPQLKTTIISSIVFSFVLSFNDVTMALFLSKTGERTLPVEMFIRTSIGGLDPVVPAMSFLLTILGLVAFIVTDRTIGTFNRMSGH